MIGFLVLMLALAATVCLGFCWISWDALDPKTRPGFRTQFAHDCARLFRLDHAAAPALRARSGARACKPSRTSRSSAQGGEAPRKRKTCRVRPTDLRSVDE